MKTLNCAMPIYNSPEKQYWRRAAKGGYDKILPVVTPRYKLPAFQFNAETADYGEFQRLMLVPKDGNVNLITDWTNTLVAYPTFVTSGANITSAINVDAAIARTNEFTLKRGEFAVLTLNLTLNAGTAPSISFNSTEGVLYNPSGATLLKAGLVTIFVMGFNETNTGYLSITSAAASNYAATFTLMGGNFTGVFDAFGGYGQKAYTQFTNAAHPHDFEVWTATGDDYAIEKTGTDDEAYADSNSTFNIEDGKLYGINISITINSGDSPSLYIVDSAGVTISNTVTLVNGVNYCIFRATDTDALSKLRLYMMEPQTTNFTFWRTHFGLYEFNNEPEELILAAGNYWQYTGGAINTLPVGIYYAELIFTSGNTLYSDWIEIDGCIFTELITDWTNSGYNTFVETATSIQAIETDDDPANASSNTFNLYAGEVIRVSFNLELASGTAPTLYFYRGLSSSASHVCTEGLNEVFFTCVNSGDHYLRFDTNFNVAYLITNISTHKDFSEDYVRFVFSNTCDIGGINYHDGLEHTLFLKGETMEPSFPLNEEGQENGEGLFVRTFARQVKKYSFRTLEMPGYIIELLHRMRMHDTIEITDTVGDSNTVYNLEVEHEWLFDDKYYGRADMLFDYDEVYLASSCCVNMPDPV